MSENKKGPVGSFFILVMRATAGGGLLRRAVFFIAELMLENQFIFVA